MFTIFRNVFANNGANLNIHADLGKCMLAFMWVAVGCVAIGFGIQACSFCACCGKRD
jgi:hypothetical protein